ncbi:hypothetical protein Fot_28743 [Forsythia ovata]|uniref:Uncharacterized protein n=1 Tax=Forsythia ovata TaxID=205694 RepID=A0ABD1TPZ0_9LAMI
MASFYFSRVPKFKIRSGRVVGENEDISHQPSVPRTASVLVVAFSWELEAMVGTSTTVLLASGIAVDIPSILSLEETLLLLEDTRRSDKKRKAVADDERNGHANEGYRG